MLFQYLTPLTYWLLIVIWAYILWFYLKRLRSGKIKSKLTVTLMIVLSIEAFRTLFESLYFGAWYTSLQGLLPREVHTFLIQPNRVIVPKLFNVLAALLIVLILIRRWLPQEEAQADEFNRLIRNRTRELVEKNERLNAEIDHREHLEAELKDHRQRLEGIVQERTEQLAAVNQRLQAEIAEKQQVEAEMRRAYTDLDQVFNGTAVAIRVIDNDYNVMRVNDMFLRVTGYSRVEIDGMKCHELFKGSTCHTEDCAIYRIRQGCECYEVEIEKELKTGERVPYLLTATPYYDLQGNRIGLIESFLDISFRREAEKTIREERDLFMEGKVIVFKWAPRDHWPVAYVSPNVVKTLGYRPEDFLEEQVRYRDIIDERDYARVFQGKHEAVRDGLSFLEHAPYRLRHKNGDVVWVLDYTRFIRNASGEVDAFHGYIIDISQYKETEEKLENQAQLAHTGRLTALGEMASGMAHELNQPMTVIRLAADGLKMHFDLQAPGSPESDAVSDIIAQVKRAAKIIRNMRAFSRARSAFVHPIDIAEPIRDALSFFTEQFRLHEIRLIRVIEPDLPKVEVDEQKFEQIVVNLITNARYAIEKKAEYAGSDYVKTIEVQLLPAETGDRLIFSVSDNGIGMSTETVQRCMEPFFTTKGIGEGTGLGLSIVHGIVKEFGMEIDIDAREEMYCTVSIRIPIAAEAG